MTRRRLRGLQRHYEKRHHSRPESEVPMYRFLHSQRRAMDRYGILLTMDDWQEMRRAVCARQAVLVGDLPHGAQAWKWCVQGKDVIFAARPDGRILTVLLEDHRQLVQNADLDSAGDFFSLPEDAA